MKIWVLLTILYSIVIGFYNCTKKKAVKLNSVYEIFAYFSIIAFIITAVTSKNVFVLEFKYFALILLRTGLISAAWLIAGYVINKIPISLYAVLMLSKIIFSILLSILLLGEKITITALIGMVIVIIGLILVNNNSNKQEKKEISTKYLILLLFSCLLSSIAIILDKKILLHITSSQLQFWFLLFLTIIFWLVLIIKEKKIKFKSVKNNYWIPIMSITLVVADRLLFMANEIPESKVSIMTILKQISTIEIILLGKIMFKEEKILKKMLCSLLIIAGIIVTLI